MMPSTRGWPLFALVTLLAAAADLATKELAFARLGMPGIGPRVVLVPEILVFETNLNEGALFGMGQGLGLVFAGISFAALVGILAMLIRPAARSSGWLVIALALVAGGILGNLYDRLGLPGLRWHAPAERFGEPVRAVRDWIHVMIPGVIDWPIFNLADSWLVIGAAMLLLSSVWNPAATSDSAAGADAEPRPD
jgi:signal peptidase II